MMGSGALSSALGQMCVGQEEDFLNDFLYIFQFVQRCVEKRTGHPIHGIETNMTLAVDSMTCACAREAAELKEIGCGMSVKYDGPASRSVER